MAHWQLIVGLPLAGLAILAAIRFIRNWCRPQPEPIRVPVIGQEKNHSLHSRNDSGQK